MFLLHETIHVILPHDTYQKGTDFGELFRILTGSFFGSEFSYDAFELLKSRNELLHYDYFSR